MHKARKFSAVSGTTTLQAANTYSGNTNVVGGTLTLSGAGSALSTTGVNLFPGTTLTLDNNGNGSTTSVNLADNGTTSFGRIKSEADLTLNGQIGEGAIEGKIGGGGCELRLIGQNGDINILRR